MGEQTVRISFTDLAISRGNERHPLRELTLDEHVYGDLLIEVQGRRLPHLGYFGPNDVCFTEWLGEFSATRQAFAASSTARYVYDEGEQGQPAFVFEREGDLGRITIAAAEYSGGVADPEWQCVPFSVAEFMDEEQRLRRSFCEYLTAAAPREAPGWLTAHGIVP